GAVHHGSGREGRTGSREGAASTLPGDAAPDRRGPSAAATPPERSATATPRVPDGGGTGGPGCGAADSLWDRPSDRGASLFDCSVGDARQPEAPATRRPMATLREGITLFRPVRRTLLELAMASTTQKRNGQARMR